MGACGSVLRQCQKTKPRRPLPPSRCQYHHQLGTKQSLKGLSGALEASGSLAALAFHSPTPPFRLLRSRKSISVEILSIFHMKSTLIHSGYFSCEACAIVCYQYFHERISAYLCYLPVILKWELHKNIYCSHFTSCVKHFGAMLWTSPQKSFYVHIL